MGEIGVGESMTRLYRSWTAHNLISHPLSEIAYLLGLQKLSNWIHDITVPEHEEGTGRG
tara:strand:- start:286 stop:462 length:177 start_codon:yes stop_codon:yes gene_type:complete